MNRTDRHMDNRLVVTKEQGGRGEVDGVKRAKYVVTEINLTTRGEHIYHLLLNGKNKKNKKTEPLGL